MTEFITVPENERLDVLPTYFGKHMMEFEGLVFDFARALLKEYDGGFWEFVEIPGGMFMYPDSEKEYTVVSPNYAEYKLPCEYAGIVVTLCALSHLSFSMYERKEDPDNVSRFFYALRDFAFDGEYAKEICALID